MVLDIIIAVILCGGGVMIYQKGFVEELFSKAGYLFGFAFSFLLTKVITIFIQNHISFHVNAFVLVFAVYLLLYFGGIFLIRRLGVGIQKLLESLKLQFIDKILGFVLGVGETVLLIAIVALLLDMQPFFDISQITGKSFFYNSFISRSAGIFSAVLEWLKTVHKK